jgi:hypothetical protein
LIGALRRYVNVGLNISGADHYRANECADSYDCEPRRQADSRLKTGDRMTGSPDTSLTIDSHHHISPDRYWQETPSSFFEAWFGIE